MIDMHLNLPLFLLTSLSLMFISSAMPFCGICIKYTQADSNSNTGYDITRPRVRGIYFQ